MVVMGESRRQGSVERGVRRDLRALGVLARRAGLAAAAVSLARQVDDASSASGAAAAARQLQALYGELLGAYERLRPGQGAVVKTPAMDELDALRRRHGDG